MYLDNLYTKTLVDPCRSFNCDELFIVSGYASATFVRQHLEEVIKFNNEIVVNMIIGMPGPKSDHIAFLDLHKEFPSNFKGYYYNGKPAVHCKTYSWYKRANPFVGFSGSANYSQYGFKDELQMNQLSDDDPKIIKTLFENLLSSCIYIPKHTPFIPSGTIVTKTITGSVAPGTILWEIPNKRVRISFLDKTGTLPSTSGLNWGQRVEKRYAPGTRRVIKEIKRNPNQAYLSLKLDSRKVGFLPERAFTFSLITDDGVSFDCAVAQQSRKAIETNKDNSLLGAYIRRRIDVPSGAFVRKEDLERYGRTDYTIEKINNETFLFDFGIYS